jgi:glycolate oxidase
MERVHVAMQEIFDFAISVGGTITGEHGVGAAKRPWLAARLGDDQMALLRRVKSAFDPAGILNPGKLGS